MSAAFDPEDPATWPEWTAKDDERAVAEIRRLRALGEVESDDFEGLIAEVQRRAGGRIVSILNAGRALITVGSRVLFAPTEAYCAQYHMPVPQPRLGAFCGWHENERSRAVLVWFDGDAEPIWVNGEAVEEE